MKAHHIKKRLGWHPDHKDYFGLDARAAHPTGAELKALNPAFNFRDKCPAVYDQGALGSCVYNAWSAALQYREMVLLNDPKRPVPARLCGYYLGRKRQGTIRQDSGSTLRMGSVVYSQDGFCAERLYPYNVKTFTSPPSKQALSECKKHKLGTLMFARVSQASADIKVILSGGNPIVFGFTVYSSFENIGKDGMMPMPVKGEDVLGGHAVMLVGYDDTKQCFLVRNSWGTGWGDGGYFWMPYAYALNAQLCQDFWTVTSVPTPDADS